MKRSLCLMLSIIMLLLTGCSAENRQESSVQPKNYKDIPGVAQAEIDAIEELRRTNPTLIYGMCPSTETFYDEEGNINGYTALFCDWLTKVFDIEIKPVIVEWGDLLGQMQSGKINFTGELTSNPERLKTYYMTSAIAERSIKTFRIKEAASLSEIAKSRNPKLAFLTGSNTWSLVESAAEYDVDGSFVNNPSEAIEKLINCEIDAFLTDGSAEAAFDLYEDIEAKDFFPLIYTPVSLSTLDSDLKPIITVLQKYLDCGAIYELTKLYNEGEQKYFQHKLFLKLTDTEKEYIADHIKNDLPISISMECDVYPIIFYNEKEKEWQGIACDVLAEITSLTGLRFETANKPKELWLVILEKLESGENAMTTELLYSKERNGRFLWADEPYAEDRYALLSRSQHEDININQVLHSKIGMLRDSAYADIFHTWYPDHPNTAEYMNMDDAFAALEKGEIDLLMTAKNLLLRETNYMENPGFKANLVFDRSYGSFFGFNKNETTLRSIISKAQNLIDTEAITDRWFGKIFDYKSKLLKDIFPYAVASFFVLVTALIVAVFLFMKNKKINKNLENSIAERTNELALQTATLTALRESKAKTARQETFLAALNLIGEVLLRAEHETINVSLNEVAKVIGQSFSASQVCIYRLFTVKKMQQHSLLCDWHVKDNQDPTPNSINQLPENWINDILSGNLVYKHLSTAEGADVELLRLSGIQTAMMVPVVIENKVWGCIRLLYEEYEHSFTESSLNTMSSIAKLIASRIMLYESAELLMDSYTTNKCILDSNPFGSIMFDENMKVIAYNLRVQQLFNLSSLADATEVFLNALAAMKPEYQPVGSISVPFSERLRAAFEEGYSEFDTQISMEGKSAYINVIIKKIAYKGKNAAIVYMFDLTAQKEVQMDLKYHDNLLETLGSIANLLLTGNATDLELTMFRVMDLIGRATSVDRVYVWKNHLGEDNRLYTSQIFEWSPDAEPQQGTDFASNISFDDTVFSWRDNLQKGLCLNALVKNTAPEEQAQLALQGIVSFLLVPIFMQDNFWGFIGFDDCQKERVFSNVEENILRICGFMAMVISDTIQNEIAMQLLAEREAALASAQIKTNFLANMSHEIRTPMNAILGMSELIMHENTTDAVLAHAIDINNASRGLLAIINDILDISKIESGKLEIVSARYYISSLLIDVIGIIKMRTDKKNIAFVVKIDTDTPSELLGDELRIKQILINLLSNAVKFTQEGQIALTVSSQIENDICRLTFSVADTGIGIKEADLEKIFVLFQQVDTKKNRNVEGTGLGLPISRQLAEMMGGSIEIESEYGVGSTFTASLNQTVANSTPIAILKHPKQNTVLVYENRSAYSDSVTYALDSLGCHYRLCTNQVEMHQSLDGFKCDYIFVSSLYVNKIQALAVQKQPKAVIVILNGDGNLYYKGNMMSLSMPIHCLQLANLFNDEIDGYYNRTTDSYVANITAPEAKVLVVDDNAVNLKVAVGLLNIYKIKADTASGGIRAVEMVCETDYDLVFMDHMMPDMDGIDTTVAIRNLGEKYKLLPIVALTANAIGGVKDMFKLEGLNDFLAKPIEMSKLNAILKKWLPKSKLQNRTAVPAHEEASFEIPGLDTHKGLRNSGNLVDAYNEILAVYAVDSENKIREMTKYHRDGDLKSLIINVHSLKSASANVGADDIAGMAAGLEAAGKTGDINYVDANLRGLFDSLSLLLDNIQSYLSNIRKKKIAWNKAANLDFLKIALTEMEIHVNNLDIDALENMLEELFTYQWNESIFQWINKIKNCVDIFDYTGIEMAVARLKEISDVE